MNRDELIEKATIAVAESVGTIIDATAPLIEADLRKRLAEEIAVERDREAYQRESIWGHGVATPEDAAFLGGLDRAARIVRGASADTDPAPGNDDGEGR